MSSFDGAFESLVQGVTEQVPTSRLPGQVSEQVNMVSDLITGVRRRVGAKLRTVLKSQGATTNLKAWQTDVGGVSAECFLNANTGELILLEEGNLNEMVRFKSDYLRAVSIKSIRHAGVGDSLFICNTERVPTTQGKSTGEFRNTGYFEVVGSALRQRFAVTVRTATGQTWVGEYTTPDGTKPEHVSEVTTSYVATKILESLKAKSGFNATITATQQGSLVFLKAASGTTLTIVSEVSRVYIVTSKSGIVEDVGTLPSSLPPAANNTVMAVGRSGGDLTYFKYDSPKSRWIETAEPGSPSGIKDMPVEIYWDGSTWVMNTKPYEGRLVGDADTNPNPEFIDWGITGITSYQGRLVILSGSWVYLSASGQPRVFYRTTVSDLIDSDTIGIGSSSTSSASFEYGEVFNKDLLLFSPEHQALIPGLNQALTPKTAHILITSTYTADMTCPPVTTGSSVMYSIPRSTRYFGMLEMIPSSYTDSMYSSSDASEHIPNYMEGRCRFAVASSVGSMVIMGSTVDPKTLYIHEYMWSGEEKVLKSWHKWTFKTNIAYAFFSGELINLVMVDSNTSTIVISNLDPKAVHRDVITSETYFLDLYTTLPVKVDASGIKTVTLPSDYYSYMQGAGMLKELKVAYAGGELNTTPIGFDITGAKITLNKSTTAKNVIVGIPFESKLVPSPPVFRDYKDNPILFNRVQMVKMYALTDRTGIFEVTVLDKPRGIDNDYNVNPIRWLSKDLNLGRLPVGGQEGSVIPTRIDATTGRVEFTSDGLDEMNIINIEYTCKAGRMRQRR